MRRRIGRAIVALAPFAALALVLGVVFVAVGALAVATVLAACGGRCQ